VPREMDCSRTTLAARDVEDARRLARLTTTTTAAAAVRSLCPLAATCRIRSNSIVSASHSHERLPRCFRARRAAPRRTLSRRSTRQPAAWGAFASVERRASTSDRSESAADMDRPLTRAVVDATELVHGRRRGSARGSRPGVTARYVHR